MWGEVSTLIARRSSFLITTHINPDGDGIGSEIALYRFLRSLGKSVRIMNVNRTPRHYRFLDEEGVIEVFDADNPRDDAFDCEIVFVLDISTSERLGPLGGRILAAPAKKICIDHHRSNDRFADVNVIDTETCATGELIYDLIMSVRGWLDEEIALPLYISIMTDTGTFRFSNTNERTHLIASHLVSTGVNPRKVYEQIYENNSIGQVRLFARILDTLEITDDGKVAWIKVRRSVFDDTGSVPEELEGMVDYLRTIGGTEVCMLFLEREQGGTKVSFRSKGDFDVNRFASQYGGGGHQHAAGMVLDSGLDESAERVVCRLAVELDSSSNDGGSTASDTEE